MNQTTYDRAFLVDSVRRWGDTASDAVLNPHSHLFSLPSVDGLIAYQIKGRHAIIFGDPICAPEDKATLALAFEEECHSKGYDAIYIIASESFTHWAIDQHFSAAFIEIGKKLILDPHNNPMDNKGTKGSLVRRKVKHARKEEVVVHEHCEPNSEIEGSIEQVASHWLSSRKGPQIHISHLHLFDDRQGKRWFYAERNGKIIGLIVLNELQARKGWLFNHLMITPDAPGGTPELLVVSALEALKKEGCHFTLLSSVPAKEIGSMKGFGYCARWLLRRTFKMARSFFHLEGHSMFWEKFQPSCEENWYVLFTQKMRLSTIKALIQALNVSLIG